MPEPNHAKKPARTEALEYLYNRARLFVKVAAIGQMSPATGRAFNELADAVAEVTHSKSDSEV